MMASLSIRNESLRVVAGTILLTLLMLGTQPTDARAQAGTPEPEAQGRLGTFSFNPGVVFSSGFDTNPYRETPAESDVETYVIPQVDGWINLGPLRTNVFGAIEIVNFANRVGARNHQFGTRSEWQGARLAPFVQFTSKHTNANPTGFEVGRKSMRNENDLNTGVRAKLSGRLFASGFFRRTATNWDADAIYQTSSLREKLNRTDTGYGGGVEVALTPLTSVRFQGETMRNDFIFSPTRNGRGYRIGPGLTFLGPAAIVGNIDVGIRSFTSDLNDVSFKGFVSNVALARTFPTDTFVSVRFDRDIQFSYDTSLAYFVGRSIQATVIQPFGEVLSVQVFLGRHNLSYSAAVADNAPLNTVSEAGVAVGRRLGRLIRIGVSTEWAKAEGNQPWDEVRVIGFLTFGLGTFQRLDRPVPFQR